jgi:hypothetical protein
MKKIQTSSFLLTIVGFLLFVSGCTVLGIGVGAIVESGRDDVRPVVLPGWGAMTEIKAGTWIEVVKKDREIVKGEFTKAVKTPKEGGDTTLSVFMKVSSSFGQTAINFNDIDHIVVGEKRANAIGTGALIGGLADVIVLVAVGSSLANFNDNNPRPTPSPRDESDISSCPFVYSYDGNRYRLEGEVFGGSIFEAARRTDFLNLTYLNDENGEYRLKITNELEETQYMDELKLLVIDHPVGTEVYPSFDGKLHQISKPYSVINAVNKTGENIAKLMKEKDDLVWFSNPFDRDPEKLEDARDLVELTFEKPMGATSASLLFNVQNTRWGAVMQKEMLALQGNQLEEWYHLLNTSEAARMELMQLMVREGMLQIKLWNGKNWQPAGFIWEVGPVAPKDVVANIELGNIDANEIKVRLEFPVGFWNINSVQVSYGTTGPSLINELIPQKAVGHNGQDIISQLTNADQNYYTMPNNDYWAEVSFKAPEKRAGYTRTFMVKSNGYYTIHIKAEGNRQDALIEHIRTTPGAYGQFTLRKLQGYIQDGINQLRTCSIPNQRPNG